MSRKNKVHFANAGRSRFNERVADLGFSLLFKAVVINGAIALGAAGYQEYRENNGMVRPDGLNFAQDAALNFAWENPKWVIETGINAFMQPE